jgi:hypothetical protein
MCLALPLAVTIPLPSQVRRSDGSRVVQHKFNSYQDEIKNLKKVLSLKEFLLIVPFLLYYVSYHLAPKLRGGLCACFFFLMPWKLAMGSFLHVELECRLPHCSSSRSSQYLVLLE